MHRIIHTPLRTAWLAAMILGGTALLGSGAQAADGQTQTQYQQDVARCNNTPGIDMQACLQEAGAAAQAARQGTLTQPSDQTAARHRSQRCDNLPAAQRQDCMTLMQDPNSRVQGSVQAGGTLRETTITIPAPASPAPPAVTPMTPVPAPTQ